MTQELEFDFRTNQMSSAFCHEIVDFMIREFGFSRDEAVGRINRQWRGFDFLREDDIRYHEAESSPHSADILRHVTGFQRGLGRTAVRVEAARTFRGEGPVVRDERSVEARTRGILAGRANEFSA